MKHLCIYTDGAARGNPGQAGAGVHITNSSGTLIEKSFYLGTATNNAAEYTAAILGLKEARRLNPDRISLFLDSELVVRQINGQYRVKNAALRPLWEAMQDLLTSFPSYEVSHIPRKQNAVADRLANEGIDAHLCNSSR